MRTLNFLRLAAMSAAVAAGSLSACSEPSTPAADPAADTTGAYRWSSSFTGSNAPNGPVSALASTGSTFFVSGSFDTLGQTYSPGIGSFDGARWSTAISRTPLWEDGTEHVIDLVADGEVLYAGGAFRQLEDVSANVAKYASGRWSLTDAGSSAFDGKLTAANGKLFASNSEGIYVAGDGGHMTAWVPLSKNLSINLRGLLDSAETIGPLSLGSNFCADGAQYYTTFTTTVFKGFDTMMVRRIIGYLGPYAVYGDPEPVITPAEVAEIAGVLHYKPDDPTGTTLAAGHWDQLGSGFRSRFMDISGMISSHGALVISTGSDLLQWDGAVWKALPRSGRDPIRLQLLTKNGDLYGSRWSSSGPTSYVELLRYSAGAWSLLGRFDGWISGIEQTTQGLVMAGAFTHVSGVPSRYVALWK